MRMLPPVSEPMAPRQAPTATAAAEPPELPPGIRLGFHGLRAGGLIVPAANSCVVVFPRITAPPSIKVWTDEAFAVAGATSSRAADPHLVGQPATSKMSLMPDRNAVQRPAIRSGHELVLGLCGSSQRLIGVDEHPGVKLGLSRLQSARVPLARPRPVTTSVAGTRRRQLGCQDPAWTYPRCSSHRSFRPRGREGNQERSIIQVDGIEQQRPLPPSRARSRVPPLLRLVGSSCRTRLRTSPISSPGGIVSEPTPLVIKKSPVAARRSARTQRAGPPCESSRPRRRSRSASGCTGLDR